MHFRRSLLVALLLPACSTSLSSFRPAHVGPKGTVHAEAGVDVSIPTGGLSNAMDAAKSLGRTAKRSGLSEDEKRDVLHAGVNLALNPPAFVEHVTVAYAPFDRSEIGLRYSAGAWRVGARRQLLTQERHGYDVTVGFAVERFTFEFPIGDIIDVLQVNDYERWNFDFPIAVGRHGGWYRWWCGPRVLVSQFDAGISLNVPAERMTYAASASGRALYLGAQGGVAIGYRHLFVGAELTVVRVSSSAQVEALGTEDDLDLGGVIVYPGIALMGEF